MDSKQEAKRQYMTTAPVRGLVLRMAVPTIISMLITNIYNMADTFFVGKLGTSATAAVGVVFPLMSVIQTFGFFFGHGSGNYISRAMGSQKMEDAEQMAVTGFGSSFLFGVILMILGLLFQDPLARLLGSTDTILPYAKEYLCVILLGAPFMASSLTLNNQLRFQGSAFFGMIGITTGGILNIFLDPLFIFVLDMGISGAAWATIISQMISFLILLMMTRAGGNIRIRLKKYSLKRSFWKEIVRGGTPSLCRQGLASVATICLNLAAGPYGDAAIAAMSIVSRIMNFASSALIGLGQGFQPVCGFNYGAGLYQRVKDAFWFCVKVGSVAALIFAVIGFCFSGSLVEVFRKGDADVIRIGAEAMRFQCITFPFTAWVTISNMMMQNLGMVFKASYLSMARQGLFFIPLVFLLNLCFGLVGIELAQPVSDLITFASSIPLQLGVLRSLERKV